MRHTCPPILAAILAVGCGEQPPRVTTYTEIHVTPAGSSTASPSVPAPSRLKWTLPAGWTESAGGAMTLASFLPPGWDGAGRGTISVMEGDAGGLEANVRRWMKQIRLDPSDEAKVRDFLQGLKPEKTTGGFGCVLVDFAPLLGPPGDGAESMLVGKVGLPGRTAFVKLTGPPDKLAAVREAFRSLCLSLQPESSP